MIRTDLGGFSLSFWTLRCVVLNANTFGDLGVKNHPTIFNNLNYKLSINCILYLQFV